MNDTKVNKDLLRMTPRHYHGDLARYIHGEIVGRSFTKMLDKNNRLKVAVDREKSIRMRGQNGC